jgi:hypothetical protein
MHSSSSTRRFAVLLAAALPFVGKPTLSALTFNFTNGGSVPADYMAAAVAAGNLWSGYFTDPITINVQINYSSTLESAVANSSVSSLNIGYASVRTSLRNDAITPDDISSSSALQNGSSAIFLINRATVGGLRMDTGTAGTAADQNNVELRVPNAVQKAIGLLAGSNGALDGQIDLNSTRSYDADRSDGIATLSYDLIGVIAHELGHVLGFQSTAELLSVAGIATQESAAKPQVADLFRFSQESAGVVGTFSVSGAATGVFDISADTRPKYFSVNGGTSSVAEFARGSSTTISGFGNGQQANHWLNSATPIGLMDPTIGLGELLSFTSTDLRFFDVIGFNPVPEGRGWAAGCMLLLGAGLLRWRKHAA